MTDWLKTNRGYWFETTSGEWCGPWKTERAAFLASQGKHVEAHEEERRAKAEEERAG